MAMFHVYVEGATDPSPDAAKRLAELMSQRYGLPIADVIARLAKGRFRVKANVDRETADVYLRDLGAVGAKVVVEEAGKPSSPAITPPTPSRTTSTSGLSAAKAPAVSRTATPASGLAAVAPKAKAVTNAPFASGLAAAFENTTESGSQDLGVLGGDSGSFALATVDGNDDKPVPSGLVAFVQFEAPPAAPASRTSAPKMSAQAAMTSTDMFAPPDAGDEDQKVEIASDEIEHQAQKARDRIPTPQPQPVVATPVLARKGSASIAPLNQPVTALAPRGRLGPLSEPRNRMAAGVIVAILVGFVPMHFIAGMRMHDANQKVDAKWLTDAASATDPQGWAALDEPALRDKKAAQHSIMITSLLMWAVIAAGAGYVWFKRVPWDKLDAVT